MKGERGVEGEEKVGGRGGTKRSKHGWVGRGAGEECRAGG